jgi:hypothetical protein
MFWPFYHPLMMKSKRFGTKIRSEFCKAFLSLAWFFTTESFLVKNALSLEKFAHRE